MPKFNVTVRTVNLDTYSIEAVDENQAREMALDADFDAIINEETEGNPEVTVVSEAANDTNNTDIQQEQASA